VPSVASTVGGAVAKYKSDGVNKNLGAPAQAVLEEVDTERADTFVFQNGRGLIISRAALNAQRTKTDVAVLAFRAGAAAASGCTPTPPSGTSTPSTDGMLLAGNDRTTPAFA